MSKKIALIFTCLFAMVSMAFAQSRVTGVVTASEDGEPVMGASILVKGTSVGTTTDLDGKFTLAGIPSGSKTLVVSYIGMKTKEVAIKSNLSISLDSETAELEEVVVTAMGIQRQAKALGYATAKVNADELTAAKASDATAALSGKVSGLQINVGSGALDQQTRIQLRGARSFKGDNGALLVLDGVQTPMNFLQTLNPNDIDNISVLKGASAAALYGSEAANGVLIVTTKSGQKGKPQFTYGYTITMNKAAYMPKLQHRFGSGHGNSAYGNIWNYDGKNSYMSIENQQFGPEFDGLEWTTGTPLEALDGEYRKIMFADLGADSRWSYYKTGWAHQHDISYSASDDRGSMYLSYQRLDQSSTVPGDKTSRQTVRFNASRNFKNLTVSAKINYTHSNFDLSNSSGSAMYTLLQVPSNYWVADFKNWANGDDGKGNSPNEYFSDYSENPYFTLDTNRRSTRQDRVSGNIDATFKATKWLKFVARAGLNIGTNFTKQSRYAFHFSEWASNVKYNASSDQTSTYNSASQHDNRFNLDIMAMTEHQLGNFELKGMLGYSMQDNYSDYTYTAATQLAIDDFFNFSNKLGDLTANNRWSRIRKTGLFGSIDLSYKGFAFVQVTGRNDWTSLLDPSKRSFFYPSVNASFVFTDAIPSLKSNVMNHWKMRASWAKVGTVNLQPYKLATLAQVNSSFPYGNTTAYRLDTTIFNKGLEPEFTNEFEVGTEFGFFNNRITLEAAAYIQRTTNQTVSVSIPTSTGYTDRYVNAGTMEGKGIELDVNIRPIIKAGDFSFNLGFNATFIKTKVVELADGADELAIDTDINGSYVGIYAIKGYSFPMIKAQDWARDDKGRVIVDAKTGLPQAGKTEIAGGTEPTVRLGITPTLKWKTFTLSATFDYRGGHKYYVGMESTNNFTGASYLSAVAGRQRIVFPNSCYWDDATQSYVENVDRTINKSDDNYFNGVWNQGYLNRVISAASWRLRELSLNYEMPTKLVKKIGFLQRVSASLVARNVFMWTPKTNIFGDPEFSTNTGNSNITSTSYNRNANGISSYGSAGSRSFGFNLSVTF